MIVCNAAHRLCVVLDGCIVRRRDDNSLSPISVTTSDRVNSDVYKHIYTLFLTNVICTTSQLVYMLLIFCSLYSCSGCTQLINVVIVLYQIAECNCEWYRPIIPIVNRYSDHVLHAVKVS